ncbi:MAG TPA: NADH dehydrogenase (quinone) subunit D [Bdellovibrionales bacterium]|nr:NADH dehydrogenase (quinone) subunit D [Bdellovibrionales bacterium]
MMNSLETLKQDLAQKFSAQDFKFSERWGDHVLETKKENVIPVLRHLKETGRFDFLMDICGADYPEREKRFEVVYHLFSSRNGARLRIKTAVREGEDVDSAVGLWKTANWHERETYDMFGIKFRGHPYLRKILTHHQFVGHPLRKDYPADKQQHCGSAMPLHFDDDETYVRDPNKNLVPLNIGPSHPATHGTLRIMAELDGETVARAGVEIGYLHRCFEKMAETHFYNQVIPYTDRLNYCSAPINNIGYCKTVERMLGVELPPKAQAMRVILSELSRFIDHIVCIGANAVDLGALTSFFVLFTERERVYSLFEKLCGARLTVALTRVGGMSHDAPPGWFNDVLEATKHMRAMVDKIDGLLTENKIWISRTRGVGGISAEDAIQFGYTGPCLRAAGVSLDLRKISPYYGYEHLDFDVPVGTTGDVYDRYLVRLEEMKQSLRIVEQVAKNPPGGDYTIRDKNIVLPEKRDVYGNIEGLMNHFMLVAKGLRPPAGEIYDATEGANGELGFYLVSDGGPQPYRLHCRGPCFPIFQSFPDLIRGGPVADVISVLGSLNIIAGELER